MKASESSSEVLHETGANGRRVFVLGPVPPPLGGVSIHVVRYIELLRSEGHHATVHSYTGLPNARATVRIARVLRMLVRIYRDVRPKREDVLHVHYGGSAYFLALAPLVSRSSARKVITFHSVRVVQDLKRAPKWVRGWFKSLLREFDAFVPVRPEIKDQLEELGVHAPETIVMPAYLPPASEELAIERLPEEVREELETGRGQGRCQLCVAAYQLGPGYGHHDVYGIQALLDCLKDGEASAKTSLDLWILVSNRPSTPEQRSAEAEILRRSASLSRARVHLHYGLPLVPVLARCDAFLRPSREDGDSVAIREAMHLGVPVLASDVVRRPLGVETFPMSDRERMADILDRFLRRLVSCTERIDHASSGTPDGRFREFVRQAVVGRSLSGRS